MSGQSFEASPSGARYPKKCALCRARIVETTTTLTYPEKDGRIKVVREVPAGVCEACGEKYLTAEVAEALERLLKSPAPASIEVPVWRFVANL